MTLKGYIENIQKKMDKLCSATKNTKESQIKGELDLVSMNKTINFISEKFDDLEKRDVKKTKLLKICQKKHPKWSKGLIN